MHSSNSLQQYHDSPEAVIVIWKDLKIISCNPAAETLFTIREKDILGKAFLDFINPYVFPQNVSKLSNFLQNNYPTGDLRIQLKNTNTQGDTFLCNIRHESFPDTLSVSFNNESPRIPQELNIDLEYLTNISSELSEISDEDKVFQLLGSKLTDLFPSCIILISRSNKEGTWLKLEKILGLSDVLIERVISIIGFNPVGRSFQLSQELRNVFVRPVVHHYNGNLYNFTNKTISERHAQVVEQLLMIKSIQTIGIVDQGQYFGFISFLNSTSRTPNSALLESIIYQCYLSIARIRSVKMLEERENQYRLLAHNVKDVIFTLDMNLKYTYISPSIRTLRGYEPSEIIGEPVYNSVQPESAAFITKMFSDQFTRIKNGETNVPEELLFELELLHKNGTPIWTEIKASFIYDKQNKPYGILGVTRDINDRKISQKQLMAKHKELNEANAQKDKFYSIIAHDLKSPFGHILNFSSLLNDQYDQYPDSKRKQFISLINKSSNQIYHLLENLLDWARSQGGKMDFFPQQLKASKLVADVVELLGNSAASKNIRINKNITENLSFNADEYMLKTVLRNLISNAIKFTPEGGLVTIEISEELQGIRISVADTGIGMDEEQKATILSTQFFTSKNGTSGERGTGLGLVLCREFVECHGGQIWVESTLGKGSKFTITIPIILAN